jgi:hypothetical protein
MIITIRYDLIETRKKYLENKKILDEEEKKKYEVQLVALKEKEEDAKKLKMRGDHN